jgi:hypothetical protein
MTWCALALAAACGTETKVPSASLDRIRLPMGLAVHHGDLLVVSSNGDLALDEATGGTLMSLAADPASLSSAALVGAVRVRSFGGDLALARLEAPAADVPEAEACAGTGLAAPLAVFGTRGSNTFNAVALGAGGAPSCASPGACGIAAGSGFGDPLAVAVACGGTRPASPAPRARAFFGFLNAPNALAWIGELDLETFAQRFALVGTGQIRGFAYDRARDRLFMAGLATGSVTPLRWVDLGGCTLGLPLGAGGCSVGALTIPGVTGADAVELRSIALANPAVPGVARGVGEPVRAYVSGRLYDASAAAAAGFRNTDLGGVLLVLDLFDDALGGLTPVLVARHFIPHGAQEVRVLPRSAGWAAARRDVVAVVSTDAGALTLLDDETGALTTFGTDSLSTEGHAATGGPVLGHQPYGLAVDPAVAGTTARLWVGSYADSFVTPIDVTLDPVVAATYAGGRQVKLGGATP